MRLALRLRTKSSEGESVPEMAGEHSVRDSPCRKVEVRRTASGESCSDMPGTEISSLGGCRILLVEDEYFLADDLTRALSAAGAEILGPINDAGEALQVVCEARIDGAVLDINVRGTMIYAVAEELRRRAAPFVFATGYDKGAIPAQFADVPRWEKPFDPQALVRMLPDVIWSGNNPIEQARS